MDILQSVLDDYLKIFPEEIRKSNKEISEEELSEIFNEAVQDSIPFTATEIWVAWFDRNNHWGTLKRTAPKMLKEKRAEEITFNESVYTKWGKPFDLLEALNVICIESGDEFNYSFRPTAVKENNLVFDLIVRLHARTCHISSEIICLMRNGFADGAYARWRALHEVVCIAKFINKHGEKAAERYYHHEFIEAYKGMIQHQKYAHRIKPDPFTEDEVETAKRHYEELLNKYGDNFKKSYGWASIFVPNQQNTNFSDIEEDVGLDHWRPYYKFASQNIHGGVKGLFNKLGLNIGERNILLVGQSDAGMSLPIHSTAISLLQISSVLLSVSPNLDRVVILKIIQIAVDEIEDSLTNIENK